VGPEALNRTWISIWEEADSQLLGARSSGSTRFGTGLIDGRRAFDHHLETQGPGRGQVDVSTRQWVPMEETETGVRYVLTVWRQPKGIADELFLRIEGPRGWHISDASLETREEGPHLGTPVDVLGMTGPPEMLVGTDVLTVRGRMTADLHVVVDLER
jgi:hypothetical protein